MGKTVLLAAKRLFILCLPVAICCLAVVSDPAYAAGTPAGTIIGNQARVTYSLGGAGSFNRTSNTATLTVAEVLNGTLTWQDAANVPVMTGGTGQVLTFLLTNTGNGTDAYTLSVDNSDAGDQFDPSLANIYLDSNANGIYEEGLDLLYVPGANDPVLAADADITVFVANDIPLGLTAGDVGLSRLTAVSNASGGAAMGTVIPGGGDSGTDAIVGGSGAGAGDSGGYEVSALTVVKSSVVVDPGGGTAAISGAVITYTIVISIAGAGATATGVTLEDPVPTDTTYVSGSLALNGAGLTDDADADAGDVGDTTAGTVTVNIGNLTSGSPDQTITFQVTVD